LRLKLQLGEKLLSGKTGTDSFIPEEL